MTCDSIWKLICFKLINEMTLLFVKTKKLTSNIQVFNFEASLELLLDVIKLHVLKLNTILYYLYKIHKN